MIDVVVVVLIANLQVVGSNPCVCGISQGGRSSAIDTRCDQSRGWTTQPNKIYKYL